MRALRFAGLIAAAVLSACMDGGEAKVPDPPPTLAMPDEYAWGDEVAARDDRMARHVTRHLGDRFGQARETHYVAADAAQRRALEDWYRARLGEEWKPAPLDGAFGPGEHGFGFARGDDVLVVAWLSPQPDGRVPVTIFQFGR